jgi:hypothetical protein
VLAVRFILARLWPRALFVLAAGWLLFAVLDSMENARFLAAGTHAQVAGLYVLRAPAVVLQLLGPALVLGTLATLGTLNRQAELTALAASGRSLAQAALPAAFALGLSAAGVHILFSQWVVPFTSSKAFELAVNVFDMRGGRYWEFYWRSEWFRAGPLFVHAQIAGDASYRNVTGVVLSDNGVRMKQRLMADSLVPAGHSQVTLKGAWLSTLGSHPHHEWTSEPWKCQRCPPRSARHLAFRSITTLGD